ncbi:MAG: DedA family protein [Candidatus Dojkabacteria bacterium]|jgi:membrane protein DedA with SNARE-associated domain|nr:DedA family protein [Candidatus Dojkabacteria bacterium]MDD2270070.1 DedA family protein [Candidatus Dojkabacteria bacterium]
MIENIVQWLTELIESTGYIGVAIAVFVESVFAPIPSPFILPFVGFVSSRTDQSLIISILAATLGAYLGSLPFYFLGRWGEKAVSRFLKKYGKYLFMEQDEVDKGFEFFDKYGSSIVFTGRLIPLVRSVISFPAGVAKMPFLQFSIYTILGSAVWSTVLTVAGYLLGSKWEVIIFWLAQYENFVIIAGVLVVLIYIVVKVLRRKKKKSINSI